MYLCATQDTQMKEMWYLSESDIFPLTGSPDKTYFVTINITAFIFMV